jgi:hypothetical protein
MKPLPLEFEGRGEVRNYRFEQVYTNGYAYIYAVYDKDDNTLSHYEVFEHRENKQYGSVTYPRSPAFGKYAYTIKGIENAERKFEELTERVIKRQKDEANRPIQD